MRGFENRSETVRWSENAKLAEFLRQTQSNETFKKEKCRKKKKRNGIVDLMRAPSGRVAQQSENSTEEDTQCEDRFFYMNLISSEQTRENFIRAVR